MNSVFVGISRMAFTLAILILAACGGGRGSPPPVSVGGTVTGLAGSGLVLTDNDTDHLAVSADGSFVFPSKIPVGRPYSVGVQTQPTNQTCNVSNGSGTVGTGDVTTVSVVCTTDVFTIGGTVAGLVPAIGTLTLTDGAGGGSITVQNDGPFNFGAMPSGTQYAVSLVGANGAGICSIQNATGTVGTSNVTNIAVTCTVTTYTGQITVSGLTGAGLVLSVGGQILTISKDGTVPFPAGVDATIYTSVSITSQPTNPNELCVVNFVSVVPNTLIYNWPVTCNPYVYTLSGTVTGLKGSGLVLSNNGATLAVNANGPFVFGSPLLATAESYSVSVANQPSSPTQYCIVQNADGTIAGANITSLSVSCSTPRSVFGAAKNLAGNPNAVVAYSVNPDSGALTPVAGSPYPAGDSTSAIAVDSGTRFLYATNQGATGGPGSNTISAYTIDVNTGGLAAVPGSPFPSALAPISVVVEPSGRYLYVANVHDNTISAFAINSGSGALTSVTGGPVVAGVDGPRQLLVHPNGKFLYLATANESNVWSYAIDTGTGALTPLAGSPLLADVPIELAIDPIRQLVPSLQLEGTLLYALTQNHTSQIEGVIESAGIDPMTGAVVFGFAGNGSEGDPCSPSSTGVFPNTFALDASRHFLYLSSQSKTGQGQLNYRDTRCENYSRIVSFPSYSVPTLIKSVTADPSGKFLFLLNPNGDASAYTIDSTTGALTPGAITPSAFAPQQPIVITKQ
jgi:Lactonase, 7-bladed beta-propeller